MKKQCNVRSLAAVALERIVEKGESLSTVLPVMQKPLNNKDGALLQELCFGVLRLLPRLEALTGHLMERPLKGKLRPLHFLIMVGLYQLIAMRVPPHAALAETVEGAVALNRNQMKGLINGVLRQFQRRQTELIPLVDDVTVNYLHPSWLLRRLQHAWPNNWQKIVAANNQRPPMWVRVNRQFHSRDAWLALLRVEGHDAFPHPYEPDALRLATPCAVSQLPGFSLGWVTVQDVSAQGCIRLLQPHDDESILDLCAAPGGKTTHILEVAPAAKVMAVDVDAQRLVRITENLVRLGVQAQVKQGDGRTPAVWCGEQLFDRILIDAPCSATGVIRRHPDIKWLRRDSDIEHLTALQSAILNAIWPHLKKGGTLIYATCSVLPEENYQQILAFLSRHHDAQLTDSKDPTQPGLQVFPTPDGGDGFFYAKLLKIDDHT